MKICISSDGNSVDSILDPRFGRAAFFAIADTDTMEMEIMENSAAATGGAGIAAGQLMVDKGVGAVITGNVGPNAMDILKAADIKMIKGMPVSVKENLEKYKKGLLSAIESSVPQHYGMQGGKK